ncbi:unnamed protein product, partial [Rotaria sp. Silwood2]
MNTDSSLSSTNNDPTLTNTTSNLNMTQTVTSHHEQYQSTNDDLFPTSNGASSSVNNMILSSSFSMSVTNPIRDYAHPWMRLEFNSEHKCIRTNFKRHQISELEKEFHYT